MILCDCCGQRKAEFIAYCRCKSTKLQYCRKCIIGMTRVSDFVFVNPLATCKDCDDE